VIFMLAPDAARAGTGAFAFGKSKAKLLAGDTPKITFADVAGCDEAKQELEEIIDFLKDPQKFQRLGGRLPKGGAARRPPGTARPCSPRPSPVRRAGPFFSMSGSDFVEMFVGVGASRVRICSSRARRTRLAHLHRRNRRRGPPPRAGLGGGHEQREQTLNQLLVEMDGLESNDGVILLAAPNRPTSSTRPCCGRGGSTGRSSWTCQT